MRITAVRVLDLDVTGHDNFTRQQYSNCNGETTCCLQTIHNALRRPVPTGPVTTTHSTAMGEKTAEMALMNSTVVSR